MDNSDILFVVPTIMNRPSYEILNLENCAKNFPESRFLFISNVEDENFSNYEPTLDNIEKYVSGVQYSISEAINKGYRLNHSEEYFCFLQSDVHITKDSINSIKNLCNDVNLNVGVVGITKHSNFNRFNKRLGMFYGMDIHKVLWADGIMFFKMSMFDSIGLFDTSYFGDKESQDFCYRAHDSGYNNLFVESCTENHRWIHNSITFSEKSKTDNSNFRKLVTESRNIFAKKWYEWEDRQTHLFV
jgi:hypothetical protein